MHRQLNSYEIIQLRQHEDPRGRLTVVEDELPFQSERTFWITEADGQVRGGHRHQRTRQGLVALLGKVTVFLDNGQRQVNVSLDNPSKCLIVEPSDWHTMTFEQGAILLVFASQPYDPADYINERYV